MPRCLEWIKGYFESPLPVDNEELLSRSELAPWKIGGDKTGHSGALDVSGEGDKLWVV